MQEKKGGVYAVWSVSGDADKFPVSLDGEFVMKVEFLEEGPKILKVGEYELEFEVKHGAVLMNVADFEARDLIGEVEFDQGGGFYRIDSENIKVINGGVFANAFLASRGQVDGGYYSNVEVRWYEEAPEVMLAGFVSLLNQLQGDMGETINKEE